MPLFPPDDVCGPAASSPATINEPTGTVLGIKSENEVFVICRREQPAPQLECETIPPAGAEVIGEAAVYRVDGG